MIFLLLHLYQNQFAELIHLPLDHVGLYALILRHHRVFNPWEVGLWERSGLLTFGA